MQESFHEKSSMKEIFLKKKKENLMISVFKSNKTDFVRANIINPFI